MRCAPANRRGGINYVASEHGARRACIQAARCAFLFFLFLFSLSFCSRKISQPVAPHRGRAQRPRWRRSSPPHRMCRGPRAAAPPPRPVPAPPGRRTAPPWPQDPKCAAGSTFTSGAVGQWRRLLLRGAYKAAALGGSLYARRRACCCIYP